MQNDHELNIDEPVRGVRRHGSLQDGTMPYPKPSPMDQGASSGFSACSNDQGPRFKASFHRSPGRLPLAAALSCFPQQRFCTFSAIVLTAPCPRWRGSVLALLRHRQKLSEETLHGQADQSLRRTAGAGSGDLLRRPAQRPCADLCAGPHRRRRPGPTTSMSAWSTARSTWPALPSTCAAWSTAARRARGTARRR